MPVLGHDDAYPVPWWCGTMPREPASAPIRRGHAADRQTVEPVTRGAGFATAFPATWPAAAPALSATQPAPSMRPETPPPAPVGPLARSECPFADAPAHL